MRSGIEKDAGRLRLNLYFDPVRRSEELTSLDVAIKQQRAALEEIKSRGKYILVFSYAKVSCFF